MWSNVVKHHCLRAHDHAIGRSCGSGAAAHPGPPASPCCRSMRPHAWAAGAHAQHNMRCRRWVQNNSAAAHVCACSVSRRLPATFSLLVASNRFAARPQQRHTPLARPPFHATHVLRLWQQTEPRRQSGRRAQGPKSRRRAFTSALGGSCSVHVTLSWRGRCAV